MSALTCGLWECRDELCSRSKDNDQSWDPDWEFRVFRHKRAPWPYRTSRWWQWGERGGGGGGGVSISPCAQQQGCQKMKRGKMRSLTFSPGCPPQGTRRWEPRALNRQRTEACSSHKIRLIQVQQHWGTEESSPLESHLTASECVAC